MTARLFERWSPREQWFFTPAPNPAARRRMLCFPYAGGNASFARTWPAALASDLELCSARLPGRAPRAHEPAFEDVNALVDAMFEVVLELADRPLLLFGHSYGGLVAYLLARRLCESGATPPAGLIVSAAPSPASHGTVPKMSELDDDGLCRALGRLGGTPRSVLDEPELREVFLPVIRADLVAIDRHVYDLSAPPIPVPLVVFGARMCERVPPRRLIGWEAVTTAGHRSHVFEGGHFFLHDEPESFLRELARAIEDIAELR